MDLLILGGTGFAGRHVVETALRRGHRVTIFTRGSRLDRDVEHLTGDRHRDVSALEGRTWDAAIDMSAYVPGVVTRTAEILRGRIGHYTLFSSISAYASFETAGVGESAPVARISDADVAAAEAIDTTGRPVNSRVYGEAYGALKALCEEAAEAAFPNRVLRLRPGLIVGPGDTTRRFTYWVRRVAAGGDVLAPGRPERRVQFVDVRDLAEWTLDSVERARTGAFNAIGPAEPLTMGGLLEACRAVTGSDARPVWIADDFLIAAGVVPWTQLPLWLPAGGTVPWTETGWRLARGGAQNLRFYLSASSARAIDAGLRFRDVAETIRDLHECESRDLPLGHGAIGLSDERQRELLARWSARTNDLSVATAEIS